MVPYVGELCAAPKILIDSTWQLAWKKQQQQQQRNNSLHFFIFFFNVQLRKSLSWQQNEAIKMKSWSRNWQRKVYREGSVAMQLT